MKRCKEIVITKADGTVERFGLAKLTSCLSRALRGRAYDPGLAGPLARAVALHLGEWRNASPPSSEYIFRCVRSVLQQTGLADVAEDIAGHRGVRAAWRRRIRVAAGADDAGVPWAKACVAATLENGYGLGHGVARFLAGQVEARVFLLSYRRLTKPFVAELVRNEVMAWGLGDEQVLHVGGAGVTRPLEPVRPKETN